VHKIAGSLVNNELKAIQGKGGMKLFEVAFGTEERERDENQIKPQVRKRIAGPTSEPRTS